MFQVNPAWLQQYVFERDEEHPKTSDWSIYHHVAARPEGPFHPSPRTPIVPGSTEMNLYGVSFTPCKVRVCDASEVAAGEYVAVGAYIDDPSTTKGFATLEISGVGLHCGG